MTKQFPAQAFGATAAATPASGTTALDLGRIAIVILLLAVSPFALLAFGWQYFDTGGSPVEKFHPATLVAGGLLLLVAIAVPGARGNPLSGLIDIAERHAAVLPFLAANAYMIGYTALILQQPVTMFIETFVGAALILLVFQDLREGQARTLALIIHALFLANALLGIYEVVSGFRLTPLVINGELIEETRATALLGHPLSNAILEGAYVVILAVGGGRDLPLALRPVALLVALISLVPFGGRAATGLTLACLAYLLLARGWDVVRGGTFNPLTIVAGLVVVPLAALALIAANELGALDTLTKRLFDDEGSAGTRIEMFELFRYLSPYDLLFGPDPGKLMTYVRLHGLEFGIESFIVAFLLNFGAVAAVIFFPAFALFLNEVRASCRPGAWLVLAYFLVVALTSISLSSKTPSLSILVMLMCILLRPGQPGPSRARRT
jgi:uncharacterized membrane protein YhaH (DUF805 family)